MIESDSASTEQRAADACAAASKKKHRIVRLLLGLGRAVLLFLVVFSLLLILFHLGDKTKPFIETLYFALWVACVAFLPVAAIGAMILDHLADKRTPMTPEMKAYLVAVGRPQEKFEWRVAWKSLLKLVGVALALFAGLIVFALVVGLGLSTFEEPVKDVAKAVVAKVVAPLDEHTCRNNLQADLDEFWGPAKDPEVTKCTGRKEEATCLVKSLYDGTYKTVPFVANCSKRHFEGGLRTKARDAEEQKRWAAQLDEFWGAFNAAK